MWQDILVYLTVILAIFYATNKMYKSLKGIFSQENSIGCGGGGCSGCALSKGNLCQSSKLATIEKL